MRVRPINMKDFDAEVERVWEVYSAGLEPQLGIRPDDAAKSSSLMGKEMKQILKPELVLIGEVGDRVVGFALALPDVNQALKPAGGNLFPDGAAQNPVLSTFDQKCTGPCTRGGGGVPSLRGGGRFLRDAGAQCAEVWATAIARCPGYWKTTC